MTSGILLLGHRSPDYVRMAWNLAALLRQSGYSGEIDLLTDDPSPLKERRFKPFSQVIPIQKADNLPFYAKVRLNAYSRFERTVFLDADAFPVQDITPWISGLDWSKPFHIQNRGAGIIHKKEHWFPPADLYPLYGIPADRPFIETNSSFIAWDNSGEANEIFTLAEHLYACEYVEEFKNNIGFYPDELAWNTALLVTGYTPPREEPICFHAPSEGPPNFDKIAERFEFIGMYGNDSTTHGQLWREYSRRVDSLIKIVAGEYGFQLRQKMKAANGRSARPRFRGIRPRTRPPEIQAIFDKRAGNQQNVQCYGKEETGT